MTLAFGIGCEGEDIASAGSLGSGNAIGVDASIPIALARCWVTISSGAFGLHSSTNSCSRWSSRPSTGRANSTSPGALTRIGLRACSSLKARPTLRCSVLPNRAEFAGDSAAFIRGTFFAGRVRGTPKVQNHSARNQMDFWDRVADSSIDNSREPNLPCSSATSPTANLLLPMLGELRRAFSYRTATPAASLGGSVRPVVLRDGGRSRDCGAGRPVARRSGRDGYRSFQVHQLSGRHRTSAPAPRAGRYCRGRRWNGAGR